MDTSLVEEYTNTDGMKLTIIANAIDVMYDWTETT